MVTRRGKGARGTHPLRAQGARQEGHAQQEQDDTRNSSESDHKEEPLRKQRGGYRRGLFGVSCRDRQRNRQETDQKINASVQQEVNVKAQINMQEERDISTKT